MGTHSVCDPAKLAIARDLSSSALGHCWSEEPCLQAAHALIVGHCNRVRDLHPSNLVARASASPDGYSIFAYWAENGVNVPSTSPLIFPTMVLLPREYAVPDDCMTPYSLPVMVFEERYVVVNTLIPDW